VHCASRFSPLVSGVVLVSGRGVDPSRITLAPMNNAVSAAIGAVAGIGTDVLSETRPSKQRAMILAGGLVVAAAIYPLARRERRPGAPLAREIAGLIASGAILSVAARATPTRARNVVATGWAAHALFDMVHDGGEASMIPGWYPAMCAGYDLAVAGRLVTA
jgi:hypothetical protein